MSRSDGLSVIPVRTAAKLLRVSRQRVYELCSSGKLSSIMVDGTVLVYRESVVVRLERRRVGVES